MSNLDITYASLKAHDGETEAPDDVRKCTADAAEALSVLLLARCGQLADGDPAKLAELYHEYSPKALVLITMTLDSIIELPTGEGTTSALMDAVMEDNGEQGSN